MRLADLVAALETIAPVRYAEAWDKVGLQIGDPHREVTGPVLLTIDLTEPVLGEAVAMGASAIVAYHPPIFGPIERLTSATAKERILRGAIEHNIAIYTPHTALDAAPGGVTDWLCEGLAGTEEGRVQGDVRALRPHARLRSTEQVKIVTFLPPDHVDQVRRALASAGAGIIGEYRLCSFETRGHGTFVGSEEAHPTTGEPGKFQRADEVRLEMVCSHGALPLALETLRQFHPYEEPAVDVFELLPKPRRRVGAGRRLVLDQGVTIDELARRLTRHLGTARIQLALTGPEANDRKFSRIGVVPGSGASLLSDAAESGCEVFVTGEMKHHDVLDAVQRGVCVILAGHTNTERGYLPRLAKVLAAKLPGVDVRQSIEDRDPLRLVANVARPPAEAGG